MAALQYNKLPFVNPANKYSAYFAEAGGLRLGCRGAGGGLSGWVRCPVVELDGARVLIKFDVDKDVHLGERTEAAIKTKSLLGAKILEVTPRGDGQLSAADPGRADHVALSAA